MPDSQDACSLGPEFLGIEFQTHTHTHTHTAPVALIFPSLQRSAQRERGPKSSKRLFLNREDNYVNLPHKVLHYPPMSKTITVLQLLLQLHYQSSTNRVYHRRCFYSVAAFVGRSAPCLVSPRSRVTSILYVRKHNLTILPQ